MSQIRTILEDLVDPNDDSLQYDPPELISRAESQIKDYIAKEIIGEDTHFAHMDECSNPMKCLFCRFVDGENYIKHSQRQRLEEE